MSVGLLSNVYESAKYLFSLYECDMFYNLPQFNYVTTCLLLLHFYRLSNMEKGFVMKAIAYVTNCSA